MPSLLEFLEKKAIQIPENINEEKYNCDEELINYKKGDIPSFFEMVVNNEYLKEDSKLEFYEKFWKKYSNPKNIKFRKDNIGKYLFWFNKKFMGTINNVKESYDYGTWKDDKYLIQITNKIESAYNK